ncbi:MAG TPA: outer membrane beta-barrel protein [Pseudomonadales bacterium]|nr:outer membrane beta-barrel protein [Pseudomonadales bacterium]
MKMNLRYAIAAITAAMTASPAALAADSDVEGLLDAFSGTEVNGWVAGSYLHRLDESDDDNLGTTYFSHPDANTFSLDQAWISLDKASTEESRAGFHLDYVYGKIAEQQGGNEDSGLLYSGWVSYLAPIGDGVEFKAGRLTTFLGGEVLETNANNSVTRGIVYGLQPITHTGVSATGSFSESIGWGFGIVNDIYDDTFDDDSSNKAVTGQLSWSNDTTYAGFSFIYGQDASQGCAPDNDCNLGIYDFLVTSDISDTVSVWANVDYLKTDGDDLVTDGSALGVSVNGRVAVSDMTGLSLRVEHITYEDDFIGAADDLKVWAVTGTTDTMLTDKLMLRGELRYDYSDDDTIFGFADDRGAFSNDNQLTALVELIYNFRAP